MPSFHLTSSFFGLTSAYKEDLWDEIDICINHLGIGYNDVLSMPTNERRYYIGKKLKAYHKQQEQQKQTEGRSSNAKTRSTTITGDQLKAKLKSGQIKQ